MGPTPLAAVGWSVRVPGSSVCGLRSCPTLPVIFKTTAPMVLQNASQHALTLGEGGKDVFVKRKSPSCIISGVYIWCVETCAALFNSDNDGHWKCGKCGGREAPTGIIRETVESMVIEGPRQDINVAPYRWRAGSKKPAL